MSQMIDPSQVSYIHPETGRLVVETLNVEASLTQQQFKEECDINNIIKRYQKTGEISHLNRRVGHYGDFSSILDYQKSLEAVVRAQEEFGTLPAQVRQRFGNDPGQLIEFINDDKNRDEAIKLGLIPKDEVLTPTTPGSSPPASPATPPSPPPGLKA